MRRLREWLARLFDRDYVFDPLTAGQPTRWERFLCYIGIHDWTYEPVDDGHGNQGWIRCCDRCPIVEEDVL